MFKKKSNFSQKNISLSFEEDDGLDIIPKFTKKIQKKTIGRFRDVLKIPRVDSDPMGNVDIGQSDNYIEELKKQNQTDNEKAKEIIENTVDQEIEIEDPIPKENSIEEIPQEMEIQEESEEEIDYVALKNQANTKGFSKKKNDFYELNDSQRIGMVGIINDFTRKANEFETPLNDDESDEEFSKFESSLIAKAIDKKHLFTHILTIDNTQDNEKNQIMVENIQKESSNQKGTLGINELSISHLTKILEENLKTFSVKKIRISDQIQQTSNTLISMNESDKEHNEKILKLQEEEPKFRDIYEYFLDFIDLIESKTPLIENAIEQMLLLHIESSRKHKIERLGELRLLYTNQGLDFITDYPLSSKPLATSSLIFNVKNLLPRKTKRELTLDELGYESLDEESMFEGLRQDRNELIEASKDILKDVTAEYKEFPLLNSNLKITRKLMFKEGNPCYYEIFRQSILLELLSIDPLKKTCSSNNRNYGIIDIFSTEIISSIVKEIQIIPEDFTSVRFIKKKIFLEFSKEIFPSIIKYDFDVYSSSQAEVIKALLEEARELFVRDNSDKKTEDLEAYKELLSSLMDNFKEQIDLIAFPRPFNIPLIIHTTFQCIKLLKTFLVFDGIIPASNVKFVCFDELIRDRILKFYGILSYDLRMKIFSIVELL